MTAPRVYADFQNLDDSHRLRLTCAGTLRDLERQGLRLHEGLVLTFYTDDADDQGRPDELRADGVVHYDEEGRNWVATIDWSALRHASDEAARTSGGREVASTGVAAAPPRRHGLSPGDASARRLLASMADRIAAGF